MGRGKASITAKSFLKALKTQECEENIPRHKGKQVPNSHLKKDLFVIINPAFHIRTEAEESGPGSMKYVPLFHAKASQES